MLSPNSLCSLAAVGRLPVSAGAVLALAVAASSASATPISDLQAGLTQAVTDGQPGAMGLIRDGNVSQYATAGVGNQNPVTPIDPNAKFRIGSNTKAFVSTVVLQLEAQGLLSINDTVAKWLPGAVNANGNDGTQITIKQLLNMTSGIPDYMGNSAVSVPYALNLNAYQSYTPQQLVNFGTASAPTNAPGAAYRYSNTNYILAGMIVQAVTGNSLAYEIQQRIIIPLGLTNTSFPTTDPTLQGNFIHGYNLGILLWPGYNLEVTVSNVQVPGAAGAIVSTLNELAIFHRALIQGDLLPPQQQLELETTVPTGTPGVEFGLGVMWYTGTGCAGGWLFNGETIGYYSSIITSADGIKQAVTATNGTALTLTLTTGMQSMVNGGLAAYCAMNP